MEIRIFEPPIQGAPTFRSAGLVTEAVKAETTERHFTYGSFSVEVPLGARHADRLREGRLVLVDGAYWGLIDDIAVNVDSGGMVLAVSGRQLKGLTADRITIPPAFTTTTGAQGYDVATGTTEAVMKHFVAGNMRNAAQPARIVYGLEIATDQGRGLADDKYMSRHDVLADLLASLGEAGGLGYDIIPDLRRHKLVFDVVAGLNHTATQSERTRVIFDVARKTAMSQVYKRNTSDSRNIFYATMSGSEFADKALTVTYLRDGEAEAQGIRRREIHLNISADTPQAGDEYNELRRLALIEAEEYRPAEAFECEIAPDGLYRYRRDYSVGDMVTVRNLDLGVTMHTRITEMRTTFDASGISRVATFGTAPLNVVGRLKRSIKKG